MKTWKIIESGPVTENSNKIMYMCPGCGANAALPVTGRAIAQAQETIIFDIGEHAVPDIIQCRSCRRRFENVR